MQVICDSGTWILVRAHGATLEALERTSLGERCWRHMEMTRDSKRQSLLGGIQKTSALNEEFDQTFLRGSQEKQQ